MISDVDSNLDFLDAVDSSDFGSPGENVCATLARSISRKSTDSFYFHGSRTCPKFGGP